MNNGSWPLIALGLHILFVIISTIKQAMPDVNTNEYNSQEKMRELYRRERRVELALEGN